MLTRLLFFLTSCFSVLTQAADSQRLFFYAESESFSEGASIHAFGNDLRGAQATASGNKAATHNQVSLGYCYQRWCLGGFTRYDHELNYTTDTLRFYIADSNRYPLLDQSYEILLSSNELTSKGFNIGYQWQVSSRFDSVLNLNYITSNNVSMALINGRVDVANGLTEGLLNLDYLYSEDQLLDRPIQPISGAGWSFDWVAHWQLHDDWLVSLEGRDLYSRLSWRGITATRARVDTENITFDERGVIVSTPVISGVFDERNATQTLPKRWRIALDYASGWGGEVWQLAYRRFGEASFYWLTPKWHFKDWTVSLPVELSQGALGLKAEHEKGFYAAVSSDHLSYTKARQLSLQMGWYFRW